MKTWQIGTKDIFFPVTTWFDKYVMGTKAEALAYAQTITFIDQARVRKVKSEA
jgi:hypothetical protein